MQLEADQVEESLDRLRQFGAVALVEGSGRVQKYRHYLYEWLGVGKVELSVMIELMLRGEQTIGELRSRASRMDPIDDLNTLRELLNSLKDKGLVFPLTPDGRGQVFTHALYPERNLENQRARHSQGVTAAGFGDAEASSGGEGEKGIAGDRANSSPSPRSFPAPVRSAAAAIPAHGDDGLLKQTVDELRGQVRRQQEEINELTAAVKRIEDELQELRRALGG